MTEHWCTYCQGVNAHNCQFNASVPRQHVYITNSTAKPAQAVPLLSRKDAEKLILEAGGIPCGNGAFIAGSINSYRLVELVEQAVRAKLGAGVPMKRGWMCLTDYRYELGEATGGVTIYSDFEDLKACRPCWSSCGVIEVGIVGKEA